MTVASKRCGGCGRTRERVHFFKDGTRPCGLQSQCNDCRRSRWLAWNRIKSWRRRRSEQMTGRSRCAREEQLPLEESANG